MLQFFASLRSLFIIALTYALTKSSNLEVTIFEEKVNLLLRQFGLILYNMYLVTHQRTLFGKVSTSFIQHQNSEKFAVKIAVSF